MNLTPRERVCAQIHHQETHPIPYTVRFDGDVAECLDAYYGGDAWRGLVDNAIRRLPAPRLEIYPTDHDAVRRNIRSWIGTWQSLYRGRGKTRMDSIDDAINTTMTFLIPLVILIIILTSRSRSRRRQSAKRVDR